MICQSCGCVFCPDREHRAPAQDTPMLYCTPKCKRRAKRRRHALRTPCPTSGKLVFLTAAAATEYAARWVRGALYVYQCPGGPALHFHLTRSRHR
jgi:hypothetical protein